MNRPEKALLALAAVLVLGAWALCHDTSQPQGAITQGQIPLDVVLWQFRHLIAPPFALVGLACGVGMLFLRAMRWETVPLARQPQPPVE